MPHNFRDIQNIAGLVLCVVLLTGVALPSRASAWLAVCKSGVRDCPEMNAAFPSTDAIRLQGLTYSDTVPDTLDLAEWAREYYHGALSELLSSEVFSKALANGESDVWVPDDSFVMPWYALFRKPDNSQQLAGGDPEAYCWRKPAPCLSTQSSPQWAIALSAITRAREMIGNNVSATDAERELKSLRGVFPYDQALSGWERGHQNQPHGYAIMLLTDLVRHFPSNQTIAGILNEYTRFMQDKLDGDGSFSWWTNVLASSLGMGAEGNGGYYNDHMLQVASNGYSAEAVSEAFLVGGNATLFELGMKVADYLRNYQGGAFWANPDPARFTADAPVLFVGHTGSYLPALYAILVDAQARYKVNPHDAVARQEVQFVKDRYEFMKRRWNGGLIGNFGNAFPLGVMLQIGVGLEKFRFAYPDIVPFTAYYEDAERWVRNQAAEQRITPDIAQHIGNGASGDDRFNRIRDRVTGTFLSDATHINQPFHDFMDNNDGLWLMRGLYDVWRNAVETTETNGATVAWVNLGLNSATKYMDVYSDVPYRGRIVVDMRQDSGLIDLLAIRIPTYGITDVHVYENTGSGDQELQEHARWDWNDRYVVVNRLAPGAIYTVRFPLPVRHDQVIQPAAADAWWYEANFGSYNNQESHTTYTGTFVGDTLVDIVPRPQGGIPRYQRQRFAQNVNGNSYAEMAPPSKQVTRFVFGASETVAVPSVTLTAGGQSSLQISAGGSYPLAYSSSNVTRCTMSYVRTDGFTPTTDSFPVPPNTSASNSSGLVGTYTFTCTGTNGQNVSKTVTITVAPAPTACTFNGQNVARDASVTAYQSSSVPFGSQCATEQRTCTNGTLSGSYTYASCSVQGETDSSCVFNRQTIAHGASVTAYQSSSVPAGRQCLSETRSCSNGTLSGTFQYLTCSVGTSVPPPIAPACVNLTRTLSRSSRGSDVTKLQTFLIGQALLAQGNASSFFGALTEAAVKKYQCQKRIICTGSPATTGYGVVGGKTRKTMACAGFIPPVVTPPPTPPISPPTSTPKPSVKHPPACLSIARTLQLDDRGGDVRQLQQYFTKIGLLTTINVTGYFNVKTQQALQQWQKDMGLISSGAPATTGWGVVGPKTRAALNRCN